MRPLWFGWRVQTRAGRVDWVGSLAGERTVVRGVQGKRVFAEWLDTAAVDAQLAQATPPPHAP